jgi:hypothetical protein
MSNLGVMIWSATTAICLFSALVFSLQRRKRSAIWFTTSADLLTGWLAFDDMFMVHAVVLPSFGIPQNHVLVLYMGIAVAYLIAITLTPIAR